jgi:hypothetical protein
MKFLGKTLVAATLMWGAVVAWCAIHSLSGGALQCVAVGTRLALPAWPLLFAVLLPMMAAGQFLGEVRTPAPVASPARRTSQK